MSSRKILAWGVHFYTSLGLIAAAGIAVLLVRGGAASFRQAFMLMVVATVIDTTDGWLARKAKVTEVTPNFDGRRLDDLIDFHTYTTLPLLLIWRAELLPASWGWWLLLPLLASAYGFSQVQAKTTDHFFLGFPSYWNVVAIYLYTLAPPAWFSLTTLLALALLTFVPVRYLYTTQGGRFSRGTNWFGAVWAVTLLIILLRLPNAPRWLVLVSLIFPGYYLVLSWALTFSYWRTRRTQAATATTSIGQ